MLTPTKPVKSCECGSPCGDCCGCTKESIGLGNVDNTSDLNKPLSTAMINALSGKVDLDTFTQLKNRVLALENSMPDITDLEHRMDEAEDDILGLNAGYNSLHNTVLSMADSITELGGRVTGVTDALVTVNTRIDGVSDRVDDLEAEDSNNVKLTGHSEQTIEGKLKADDPIDGATDKTLVTANWVSQTGNSAPNNLIHKTGVETKTGRLILPDGIDAIFYKYAINTNNNIDNAWRKAFSINMLNNEIFIFDILSGFNNSDTQNARIKIYRRENSILGCYVITSEGSTQLMASASNYIATLDSGIITFYTNKRRRYSNLFMIPVYYGEYGYNKTLPIITYLNTDSVDPSTETHDAISIGAIIPYHNEA